jgi:hypothetical protein
MRGSIEQAGRQAHVRFSGGAGVAGPPCSVAPSGGRERRARRWAIKNRRLPPLLHVTIIKTPVLQWLFDLQSLGARTRAPVLL